MKHLLLFLLFLFSLAGYSQSVDKSNVIDVEKKVSAFFSEIIPEDLDFHIIELSDFEKFNLSSLKRDYLEPSIFTEKKEKNISHFAEIEKYEQLHLVSLFQPVVIGLKEKDEEVWTPYWFFIFYDASRNIMRLFSYIP